MGFSLKNVDAKTLKEFKEKEMRRILNLPIKKSLSEDLHEKFSRATLLPSAEIDSLLKTQSAAIVAYLMTGGLFGYIKVGGGKTLISVACAAAAYRKGLRKILLFVPPKLVEKTVNKDLPWLRRQIAVNLPVHVIAGKNHAVRIKTSKQESGLFIMAWSQLSINDTDELLNNISPELIIADEAHNLSNQTSGRYKRVNRYMNMNPETEFIALSGTMGKKSLNDYYHLLNWCLKDSCPLPDNQHELCAWSNILDSTFSEYTSSDDLEPLRMWAVRNTQEPYEKDIAGYRKAYNYRLSTTPGVEFAVGENDIGTSILFQNIPAPFDESYPGAAEIIRLRDQLHNMDISPSGDVIDYAIHKFRYDYELTAGIYNSLIWPTAEKISSKKDIPLSKAEEILEKSRDYHHSNQEYHREVRKWLEDSACEGLDTPMLLASSMKHHGEKFVGHTLFKAWEVRQSFDFAERVERDSKAVRVCDYKIKAALAWLRSINKEPDHGVIIWWKNREVGKWAYELFKQEGVDALLVDASPAGSKLINDENNYNRVILASITAYREGLNLQKKIPHMYFLQFPREAHYVEQATGRNHRTGCPFDELVYTTNFSLDFDHQMFSAVLADALFQHQAGSAMRLIYGDYDPVPKITPGAVLREKGIIQGTDYDKIEQKLRKRFG